MQLLSPFYVGIRFTWTSMSFVPVWANPLWELIGSDVTAQYEKLSERIHSSIDSAIDMQWLRVPLHKSELPVGLSPPFWFRCVRYLRDTISFAKFASGDGL